MIFGLHFQLHEISIRGEYNGRYLRNIIWFDNKNVSIERAQHA